MTREEIIEAVSIGNATEHRNRFHVRVDEQ